MMAKKNTRKSGKSISSSSFVNMAKRKKQQKIVFGILTFVLGAGLVGSSMFWAFGGRTSFNPKPKAAGAQQQVTVQEQIADLEKQLQEDPKNTRLMGRLASLYWNAGQSQRAAEIYQQALEIKPDDHKLRKDLALTYYLMGEYDKAVHQMEVVVRSNPEDAEAHFLLGQFCAYRSDGGRDVERGIAELETFIRLRKEGIDVQKAQQMIDELKAGQAG